VVTDNLLIRLLFFLLALVIIFIVYAQGFSFGIYLVGAIPILFSELINPQAFYLSLNKMKFFNVANLIGRSLGVGLVWYCCVLGSGTTMGPLTAGCCRLISF
jgi:hypothetical protein